MALIVQHFKQNKVPKVYIFSDKQVWIKKGDDLYMDAIDLEGQEVYYTETDDPLPPEITGEDGEEEDSSTPLRSAQNDNEEGRSAQNDGGGEEPSQQSAEAEK